ncbi:MAG: PDZ domain-containing protein [Pirellulaceae bacterium]|nr:PDZ domain-containing protein [Pirellulaceae bacterium]
MHARIAWLLAALSCAAICTWPAPVRGGEPPVMIGLKAELASADDRQRHKFDGPGGLIVLGILPKGPAAQAGLQVGDLLVVVEGQRLTDPRQLHAALRDGGGAELRIDYLRDGIKQTALITPVTRRDLDLLGEEAEQLARDNGLGDGLSGLLKNFSPSDLLNLGDLEIDVRRGGSSSRTDDELERAIQGSRDPIAIYGRINVGQLLSGLWSGDSPADSQRLEAKVERLQRELNELKARLEALEPSPSTPQVK